MGTPDAPRQRGPERPLVAFDFDGTLTVRDSFTDFLKWRINRRRHLARLVRLTPAALTYLRHRDRGRIKAAAVKAHLRGLPREQLAREAEAYAEAVWSRMMRPDALARWNDWKANGAEVVIVTASPEITVEPFARRLGAERLLGTRLTFDADDRVLGPLDGPNCRADEKVRRLQAVYGQGVRLAAAYGDTSGDTEMLAIAEEKGWRVFEGRP
jgi:phosphatidylglycerophosphatase C